MVTRSFRLGAGLCTLLVWGAGPAMALDAGLLAELRQGGYVLVMRHASAPFALPTKDSADPENGGLERQLDEKGRDMAVAMGRAFKALHIPVGKIYSSPTYRARETIKLAAFGTPVLATELGEPAGGNMAGPAKEGAAAWINARVAEKPATGTDTVLVTHIPNLSAAFGDNAKGLADSETMVFLPDGKGGAALIAKVPAEDWSK